MADIFVSYTSSDRDWAFWIARELDALGHTPHVHEWEIKSGDDIYAWMETRHDAADHVLCVVSDEYLNAPYSTLERNAALWRAASKQSGFVLLVAVRPCKLPSLADHVRRCELYGVPEGAARLRLREFMQKRETPVTVAFPGKVFAVSNIPVRVPEHFLGRDDALAAIETALARYEGRAAITALHGLRGVGKTTLAAAFAERHRGDYRATWWIRAQTEATMHADLVALGVRLGWVGADEKDEPALAAVMERLRHEGKGILLIFDSAIDADALKPHLPRGGAARVLITSNAHAWRDVAAPVEIRLWPREIGADYLVARTGRDSERDAALALSEALDGLPLAHAQAAAYCEHLEISLADYRGRFEAAPARLLDDTRHAPTEYHDRLTVAKTFALAIEEAAKIHPAAEPLIVHAALLAAEPIPIFLFSEAREMFGEPLASALAGDGLDEAVAALRSFALIDRERIPDERDASVITQCIRLHRLVRQVAAARCEGETRENIRQTLLDAFAAIYPEDLWNRQATWPQARRLDLLALRLVDGDSVLPKGSDEKVAQILHALADFRYHVLAAYAQAQPLYERALAIREKALGSQHQATAQSLNSLAQLLSEHGDVPGAMRLQERALAINEAVFGTEHPETAWSLNNLAFLLFDQGKLSEARPLYERALAIREKIFGSEHSDTAISLNDLANLLRVQGEFARAQALYERAVSIYEHVRGRDHPEVATSLSNLGRLLVEVGRTDQAEPLFRRAISIGDKAFGDEHPLTLRYKSQYAELLLATCRPLEALQLGQAALATHEQKLGPSHYWTRNSASLTASTLDALGRAEEAKALRERYGIEHKTRGIE